MCAFCYFGVVFLSNKNGCSHWLYTIMLDLSLLPKLHFSTVTRHCFTINIFCSIYANSTVVKKHVKGSSAPSMRNLVFGENILPRNDVQRTKAARFTYPQMFSFCFVVTFCHVTEVLTVLACPCMKKTYGNLLTQFIWKLTTKMRYGYSI